MEFGVVFRFVDLINLILIISCLVSNKGREPYLNYFGKTLVFRYYETYFFYSWDDVTHH